MLGFAHNARDAMDHWVSALGLNDSSAWIEAPVVGDVNTMIRPMIRTGMRSRYGAARRLHVTPVFDDAEPVRQLATPRHGDVVVLVVDGSGQIIARADGPAQAADITRLRAAMNN